MGGYKSGDTTRGVWAFGGHVRREIWISSGFTQVQKRKFALKQHVNCEGAQAGSHTPPSIILLQSRRAYEQDRLSEQ